METELETIARLIRKFFFNSGRFYPSDLIVVTWDRVGPYSNGIEQVCADTISVTLDKMIFQCNVAEHISVDRGY